VYLIPRNVTQRFEFFPGFGWPELGQTLAGLAVGGLFFFVLGLFGAGFWRLLVVFAGGAGGYVLSMSFPKTGKTVLALLRDAKRWKMSQRRYLYRFGTGGDERMLLSKGRKAPVDEAKQKKLSAQEWLPVKDIGGSLLYRPDKHLAAILKIEPLNISLLSDNEKIRIIGAIHEVINSQREPMQWLSTGRSVDLDGYIASLEQLTTSCQDYHRKKLLRGYIRQAAEMATGGNTLERRFYIVLTQKQAKRAGEELLNRARELAGSLAGAGLQAELCSDRQIIDLFFTMHNPGQAAVERAPDHAGPYMPPITKGAE
jgi:hypothetical protein